MSNNNLDIEMIKHDVIKRGERMKELMNNRLFQEFILDGYLGDDIREISLKGDLSNESTLMKLKARNELHNYLYGIILEAEKLANNIGE